MTEDRVIQIVNSAMNAAITNRLEGFEKKLGKKLDERDANLSKTLTEGIVGAVGAQFEEKLKALTPKPEEGRGKDAKGKKDEGPEEESPAVKALREQLEQTTKDLASIKKTSEQNAKAAAEERAKARNTALSAKALEELGKHGLVGKRADLAFKELRDRIAYESDKSDTIVFRKGEDDTLSLEEGLREWAGSEDAKILLPPKGVQGSGGGPLGSGAPSGKTNVMAQLGESLAGFWNIPTTDSNTTRTG